MSSMALEEFHFMEKLLLIMDVVGKVCLNAPIGMWFKVMYTGN